MCRFDADLRRHRDFKRGPTIAGYPSPCELPKLIKFRNLTGLHFATAQN